MTGPAGSYRFGTTDVASAIALSELRPAAGSRSSLRIVRGPVDPPAEWHREFVGHQSDEVVHRLARVGVDYVVDFEVGARCRINHRFDRVVVDSEVDGETLARLLVHQLLPMVVAERGALVVHGSAVVIDGRGVAFVGPSGAGKSTAAAAVVAASGASLIADDTLLLDVADHQCFAEGTYAGAWLYQDRNALTGLAADGPLDGDKSLVLADRLASCDPVPLAAVFVLDPWSSEASVPVVEVLTKRELFFALYQHAFKLDPERRSGAAALFDRLGNAADSLRCRRLRLPDLSGRPGTLPPTLMGLIDDVLEEP